MVGIGVGVGMGMGVVWHGYGCGVACECMFIHALADDKWYGGYRLYYRDIVSTK